MDKIKIPKATARYIATILSLLNLLNEEGKRKSNPQLNSQKQFKLIVLLLDVTFHILVH